MKKIGFIDHYLNNFHANRYLQIIREGRFGDRFQVACAYGEVESGGLDTRQWCENNGVRMLETPEQVVDASDCVIVLSPNNPERHLELSQAALESGKPCYIDKTFAPDRRTAQQMIEMARRHGTPMFSTSALRFVPEIPDFLGGIGREHPARAAAVRGPSSYEIYAVHVIEPLVMLLGRGAGTVSFFGSDDFVLVTISYADGRLGAVNLFRPTGTVAGQSCTHPFEASVLMDCGALSLHFSTANMFRDLVDAICEFFLGGPPAASHEDTLEVMAIIEAGRDAMASPGKWVDVPQG